MLCILILVTLRVNSAATLRCRVVVAETIPLHYDIKVIRAMASCVSKVWL